MKRIALLGATGSIGASTIEVVCSYPEEFKIVSFSFYRNLEKGKQLIKRLLPQFVAVATEKEALALSKEFPSVQFGFGLSGLVTAATMSEVSTVLTAVTGSIGLVPTLEAIKAHKEIALANKETLVMGGELVMQAAKAHKVRILPVDSEHSAIFQCLQGNPRENVSELLITASGGSFRDYSRAELKNVGVKEALRHPNWSMGQKITIDSATMINKGLEVIEAHWLFQMEYDKIRVILHKESLIHSMIVFKDGAYLAQLGASDMREPIQYALTYPKRVKMKQATPFDLTTIGALHFEKMSFERFPLLKVAFEAGRAGGTLPSVMNAANEVAVEAFLNQKIQFLSIEKYVQEAMMKHQNRTMPSLETLLEVDRQTRVMVNEWIKKGLFE